MAEKPSATHTLGLEISGTTLRGAQLSVRKGSILLDSTFSVDNTPEQIRQDADLQTSLDNNLIVTALPGSEVLVRQLEVKLKKEADIDAVLTFQAEPLIPYPIESALVDRFNIGETPDGTLLTIIAAKKEAVQQHIQQWNGIEIEPEAVTCVPAALALFSHHFALDEGPQFIVHIGRTATPCVLVKAGKLLASQTCPHGIDTITEALQKEPGPPSSLDQIDFNDISKETHPALSASFDAYRLELTRTVYALTKLARGQEVQTVLLTGEGAHCGNLAPNLCKQLNKRLIQPQSKEGFALSEADLQTYAITIGAALSALPKEKNQTNFRQGELAYPNPWKRYMKPLALYLGLCLLMAAAFLYLGKSYIGYREESIRNDYTTLLASMHRPYSQFEKEFETKTGVKVAGQEGSVPLPGQLSMDDISARLRYLENGLQSTPDIYPLLPNVPTVSDVLAWLSTHPKVISRDAKTGALTPLLQIENFSYTMVKRPDQTKKQEKYQVKVEVEFSSPTPKMAREFHDALIAPNDLVDPKAEVKWSTSRGLYRASFFLKDKTGYPGV